MVSFPDGNLEIKSREPPEQKLNHGYTWRGIAAIKKAYRRDAKERREKPGHR